MKPKSLGIVVRIARKIPRFIRVHPVMAPVLMAIGCWGMIHEYFAPRFDGAAHWVSIAISFCIVIYSVSLLLQPTGNSE